MKPSQLLNKVYVVPELPANLMKIAKKYEKGQDATRFALRRSTADDV